MFKEHGYGVQNADDTVHYIYEKDKEVIAKVEAKFPGSIKDQQMPDRDKLKKADYIISTDNNIEDTKSEVKEVAAKIKLINPKAWNTFFNQ